MGWTEQLGFDPTKVGDGGSGWIPFGERTKEMDELHESFMEDTPGFRDVNRFEDLPKTAVTAALEIKVTGAALPRIWQRSGSCVGAGGWMAFFQSIIGDIAVRGDREAAKAPFPWATYGVGRQMSGSRRTGEGSTGSAQAKAMSEWGVLPLDFGGLPQPTINKGWVTWSSSIEIDWSHPSGWPKSKSELDPEAKKYRVLTAASVRSTQEVASALAQGYGVTLASMFGTRDERENQGYVVGSWSASWSHQMSCGGYTEHPSLGRIFWIQNQWNYNAHPVDPFMAQFNVNGGFWITEKTMQKIIDNGEVYIFSATMGFPVNKIDWSSMGII